MTSATRHRYRTKANRVVTAVQLDLDTQGFTFHKWGDQQRCNAGDWLVRSDDGDCYTVANDTFLRTYREVSPGRYQKHAIVHARQASTSGRITTREGTTAYEAGDYLIENSDDPSDTYAISQSRFHELYERV